MLEEWDISVSFSVNKIKHIKKICEFYLWSSFQKELLKNIPIDS